jgi:hypothetical protein
MGDKHVYVDLFHKGRYMLLVLLLRGCVSGSLRCLQSCHDSSKTEAILNSCMCMGTKQHRRVSKLHSMPNQ